MPGGSITGRENSRYCRYEPQPPPPHPVFEALVAPDRDGSRPWRLLLAGEQRPQILEAGRPNLIIWSSLWITRPDVRVR